MHWAAASLISALFLGGYEVFTKHAVRGNAVLPVLFLSTASSASVWALLMALEAIHPGTLPATLTVTPLSGWQHAQLLLKSLIVGSSWGCVYFAVKHLPVSISSPIRATSPVWTLLGALVFLAERPTGLEILGVATTLISFFGLSLAGREEGIHFHRNPWIGWVFLGTLLAAVSALYDKFLMARAGFNAATVQAWFCIYLTGLLLPLLLGWKLRWWTRGEFEWRWSILLLALSLLVADFLYFSALRDPAALISLVSSLRRGS
ncbi:MAG TPA: EamA family transporter, partial [Candidatus Limnocylindria bacterium]|nr:EamA family transporter [Candidatus Limnocylindria bacterium]